MKVRAGKKNHEFNMEHLIQKMSKSIVWNIRGQHAESISVDTPEIVRGKYLQNNMPLINSLFFEKPVYSA